MTEYALYIGGVFKEARRYEKQPEDIKHKEVSWYPVVREYGEPGSVLERGTHYIRTVDPATLPPPVPVSISDRQFFQQLAVMKLITEDEAEAAVATGTLPASLAELIALLPEQARHPARMLLKGATVFERAHEMTDTIAWLYGFDGGQTDDLFRGAAAL